MLARRCKQLRSSEALPLTPLPWGQLASSRQTLKPDLMSTTYLLMAEASKQKPSAASTGSNISWCVMGQMKCAGTLLPLLPAAALDSMSRFALKSGNTAPCMRLWHYDALADMLMGNRGLTEKLMWHCTSAAAAAVAAATAPCCCASSGCPVVRFVALLVGYGLLHGGMLWKLPAWLWLRLRPPRASW